MAANVEAEAVQLDGPADAADIDGILFDDPNRIALLGQQIGGGKAGRTCANDGDIHIVVVLRHLRPPMKSLTK